MKILAKTLATRWRSFLAALIIFSTASVAAWADAPGRVARLSSVSGDVQLANEREGWRPIPRNYAVTAGDNLWVSDGGRAELDVGRVQIWLAGGSNVNFERLDDQSLIARVSQGAMAVRIRAWEQQDAMRVLTATGEVVLLQPGFYLINAASQYAPASLAVRSGQAEVNSNGPRQLVNQGNSVVLDGNGARFDRDAGYAANGGFESWAAARDRRNDRWDSRNAGQLSPWMVGARDLDEYGSWDNDYEYGRIWYPTAVAANWAPYRNGRWSWVQPWGWTWVDDAAWGFAPFHYGRWVRIGNRWAWSPGASVGRPVYAPALVTFFGGDGWSVSANVGPTYSWVPLGWNEPFVPWYSYSPNYWRQVNRPHVRNIAEEPWRPNTYVHASIPTAISAMAIGAFVSGRPVTQHLVRNIAERDIRSAPPARMGEVLPQFQPGRGGARPSDPNPVVSNPGGGVRERSMAPAVVAQNREAGAFVAPLAPNTSVVQPRVWQDPNPVVNRAQYVPARPVVSENPGLRPPAIPMPKDSRERVMQRGDQPVEQLARPERRAVAQPQPLPLPAPAAAPVQPVRPAQPQLPLPVQPAAPVRPPVAQPPAPAPAPRVVEERRAPAGPVSERAPSPAPAPREKERATPSLPPQ
jgi:hypothetical protein